MSLSSSVLDFFIGAPQWCHVQDLQRSHQHRAIEKVVKNYFLPLWQALVSLDSLRVKTRPPAHNCWEPRDTSQGHKSLSVRAVNNFCEIAPVSSASFLRTYSKIFSLFETVTSRLQRAVAPTSVISKLSDKSQLQPHPLSTCKVTAGRWTSGADFSTSSKHSNCFPVILVAIVAEPLWWHRGFQPWLADLFDLISCAQCADVFTSLNRVKYEVVERFTQLTNVNLQMERKIPFDYPVYAINRTVFFTQGLFCFGILESNATKRFMRLTGFVCTSFPTEKL